MNGFICVTRTSTGRLTLIQISDIVYIEASDDDRETYIWLKDQKRFHKNYYHLIIVSERFEEVKAMLVSEGEQKGAKQ